MGSLLLSKLDDVMVFDENQLTSKQGNQLTRDLNVTIAVGKNWPLPWFWGPVLRYISAPILAMLSSFAYPSFNAVRNDPLHIFGFIVGHVVMVLVVLGLIVPRSFDVFIPKARRGEGDLPYAPSVLIGEGELQTTRTVEEGFDDISHEEETSKAAFSGIGHDDSSREGRDSLDMRRRVEAGETFSEPKGRL